MQNSQSPLVQTTQDELFSAKLMKPLSANYTKDRISFSTNFIVQFRHSLSDPLPQQKWIGKCLAQKCLLPRQIALLNSASTINGHHLYIISKLLTNNECVHLSQ